MPPTFRHGKTTGVYLDGMNVSPFFNSADAARTVDTHEVTPFESEAKQYIAGMNDGSVSLSGFYDSSATGEGAEEMLQSLRDSDVKFPASIFLDGGVAIGRACRMATVLNTSYAISTPATDVASAKAELTVDGGLRYGKCLHAKAPVTDVVTATPADYGAVSEFLPSSGGVVHIHPIANTRSTATEVKVQQSADSSVWIDHATISIPAASRAGVAAPTTGTNLRYVRALITPAAGTGSATLVVAFARNAG